MKKRLITLIALMFAFVAISSAQAVPMTGSGDSLSNAATKYCTYKVPYTATAITVQFLLTRASGTVAGKTYLEVSVDGVTYFKVDSMTALNYASNSKCFVVSNPKNYSYIRTTTTGSGTMKVYITAKILARKD